MSYRTFALAIVAATATGCTGSREPTASTAPQFAASGKVDQTSRARYTWADSVNVGTVAVPQWVPAGWRGDGRRRDGTPSVSGVSNEYQGDFCGVWAVIYSGAGTNNNFDAIPNRQWSTSLPASCQPARSYRVYLNGPTSAPGNTASDHTIFTAIATMAGGETRFQSFHSGTLADLGVGLWFDDAYPPASSVLVTRLQNVTDEFGRSVRQWRIETRGTHLAMGAVVGTDRKGTLVPTGTTYYLPFVVTVTEVPYPYEKYP
jgi:hypothetical protein